MTLWGVTFSMPGSGRDLPETCGSSVNVSDKPGQDAFGSTNQSDLSLNEKISHWNRRCTGTLSLSAYS
jgi:hypothetical protein